MYIQWGWQWDEWKMKWVWNWLRGVWKLGHLVWNTMLRVRNACAWYEMKCTVWNKNSFHKVWNFCMSVWKKISRYEKHFKSMKKNKGMKLFLRVCKSTFWIWKKINFCKFPISYPRAWKYRLFFPDGHRIRVYAVDSQKCSVTKNKY